MFLELQDYQGHAQLQRGLLRATLPTAMWRFLEGVAPDWEAPVDGSASEAPRVPDASEFDLRAFKRLPAGPSDEIEKLVDVGSNNWAVAGTNTANGAAILANDMHLELRVPNIWYRVRLRIRSAGFDAIGVTLPGWPSIVAGDNHHIAWGFTNSFGEFAKVIRLAPSGNDAAAFATADGERRLDYIDEVIKVKGNPDERLRVAETPWGPVIGMDWEDRPYALQWTAHRPDAVNLQLLRLEEARNVAEALDLAPTLGLPGQNILVADSAGDIGWSIAGRLPQRDTWPRGVPQLSTERAIGFHGWLPADKYPRVVDPSEGFLWSANARVVGGDAASQIGDDGMDRGARARQIAADLHKAGRPFTTAESLAIQLDDRALFLERWRALACAAVERASASDEATQRAAADVLSHWGGRATPKDVSFRLVNRFRAQVQARVFHMLIAPAHRLAPNFKFEIPSSFEGPLWQLMKTRPLHLLAPQYLSWEDLIHEALIASEQLPAGCTDLQTCNWAQVNEVRIRHPLSEELPLVSRFLDMPPVRIAGGIRDMPRIQGPDFGASERFSVSPGHEEDAYFQMPGGQSGHPLSPFYRAGFSTWAEGRPASFLPGPTMHSLVLSKAK